MGMAQIFDTHAAVKDLVASRFNERQAEAITTTTTCRFAETSLATKKDIAALRHGNNRMALGRAMFIALLKLLECILFSELIFCLISLILAGK